MGHLKMTLIIFGMTVKNNIMKKLYTLVFILLVGFVLLSVTLSAQTIGKTKTEEFKADFEKKKDISAYMNYNGPQIPIQILKCGINDETYEMYPELKIGRAHV